MKLTSLLLVFPAFASAAYPEALVWTSCGQGILCGDLEFCQDGNNYGYRSVGDTSSSCGQYPGPLIRMSKGTTYKLTLHNNAAVSTKTNIHTHGLHIVGDGDSDDVTRFVFGGECLTYTWDISSDHVGGTNWYHPHYHELTNEQTSGGAFGMLIIEDDAGEAPVWAHNDILLQISKTGPSTLGNGVSNDLLPIISGQWYRLRVSVVTPGAKPNDVTFVGGSCSVFKVASDGVWHSAAFDAYPGTAFELTGASRADFAIKCITDAGDMEIKWAGKIAATVKISNDLLSDPDTSTIPPGVAPPRPYALEGFDTASLPSVPSTNTYDIGLSAAKINGFAWDEDNPIDVLAWDEVHEWTISGSGAHPFHLHLYHMLVVSPNGCGGYKFGEFYDTISASGSCVVRFKSADFGQRMVMHCHVLSHEDNGAMVWMDVQGSGMSENNNIVPSGSCSSPSPAPVTTSTPAPVTTSTPAPVTTSTPAPVPTSTASPVNCPSTCSTDADCCNGKCNTKRGVCKGNRFLRV